MAVTRGGGGGLTVDNILHHNDIYCKCNVNDISTTVAFKSCDSEGCDPTLASVRNACSLNLS